MEIFFEKDFAKISYNSANSIIIYQWLVPPTDLEFKHGCEQMIEAIAHFKTGKVVVDIREQGTVAPYLLEWMTSDWISRAVAAGYTHGAIIIPTDVFTQLSVDEIMDTVSKKVISRNFDGMEDAVDWIKKQ
ncbi:hypothetical protein GCM10009122_18040 [Fulvivirga kasyanovii]|uniref:STAS/SEC14 domain-containing protein n=1 Tax=Fulvivirga kasyanovii TaxID=396812 RepID=A0ABW9S000_9BACT|nr:hypothetical protein [Fulvivirga kasyanovii]MTI28770.1 hypothetical protein [Fulvivirga kasyanovii]